MPVQPPVSKGAFPSNEEQPEGAEWKECNGNLGLDSAKPSGIHAKPTKRRSTSSVVPYSKVVLVRRAYRRALNDPAVKKDADYDICAVSKSASYMEDLTLVHILDRATNPKLVS